MKTTEFNLGPKTLHLYFNGDAMFLTNDLDKDLNEGEPDWLNRMLENSPAGKQLLCKVAHILADQGERCRRYLGYDPQRIPGEEEISMLVTPRALIALRSAVMTAIDDGFGTGIQDDNGDIDLGLAELEKKTRISRSPLI